MALGDRPIPPEFGLGAFESDVFLDRLEAVGVDGQGDADLDDPEQVDEVGQYLAADSVRVAVGLDVAFELVRS